MDGKRNVQPTIDQQYVAKQPQAQSRMSPMSVPQVESKQESETLRLRGGCPGKLCGLPILPCRVDCWIIPLPCC